MVGEDGLARCPWGAGPPEYRRYHDEKWGMPVAEDRRVLEKLCLEGFQSGLSWLTILRKREAFRRAFARFDPVELARFGELDVDRLLADAGIVRHRGKILATVGNARATLRLQERGGSLADLVWSHLPASGLEARPAPERPGDVPSETPESAKLSAELRRLGFRFVGPKTVYAAMQSLGLVDDHLASCWRRQAVEAARARFDVPRRAGGPVPGDV